MKTKEIISLENNTGVLMEVFDTDNFKYPHKRFVIGKTENRYISWANAEDEMDIDYKTINTWKYARPITEVPEYTMEELTAKLGHEFKIKK
jgi:hypothetical protein